jgi:uncharacterized protein (TIGR02271 family)
MDVNWSDEGWRGATVVGSDGERIGKVDDLYVDDETGKPSFFAVHTGLFGRSTTFVPVQGADWSGEEVRLPYSKDKVKDAPRMDPDGHLEPDQEDELYRYYELSGAGGEARGGDERDRAEGYDTTGPTTDDAMTRSEEELRVGTREQEAGRARLRKYVVQEQVQTTVPVTREEVRVEREAITDENVDRATSGPELSEEEHEIVLHEEQPVVEKTVVPKERVRLTTDTVTEEEQVDETVAKERIDTEGTGIR